MGMLRRKIAIGAAVLATAAGVTLAGGAPAAADAVTVPYTCGGYGYPTIFVTMLDTITEPPAAPGQTVTLPVRISRTAPQSYSSEAGINRGELDIHLGGASSGVVKATGLANPRIEAGTPWRLEGQVQVTLGNAGTVTFTPGAWKLTSHPYGCGVRYGETAPVAATTNVR